MSRLIALLATLALTSACAPRCHCVIELRSPSGEISATLTQPPAEEPSASTSVLEALGSLGEAALRAALALII